MSEENKERLKEYQKSNRRANTKAQKIIMFFSLHGLK